jgi:hypothetical protein
MALMSVGPGDELSVDPTVLEGLLGRWVERELISREQADGIRAAEASAPPSPPSPSPPGPAVTPARRAAGRHIPLIAEALGYVGAVLAAAAVGVAVNQFWADLETWAKLLVVGYTTLLMAGAAASLRSSGEPAFQRLSSMLLLIGTLGVAVWLRLLFDELVELDDQNVVLLASTGALVAAAGAFRMRAVALQQVALAAAAAGVLAGVVAQYDHADVDLYGAAVWGLGVDWVLLGFGGFLRPRGAAYVLGTVGALLGAQLVVAELTAVGAWLGIATAVLGIAGSLAARSRAMLALGAIGLFAFVTELAIHYVGRRPAGARGGGLGIALILFVAGIGLLGAALLIARLRERVRPEVPNG